MPRVFSQQALVESDIEEIGDYPHLIFYELFSEEIRILYFHHGARHFEVRHHKEERT